MNDIVHWGVLGNATIARKCVLPAMAKARNGRVQVLATRRPGAAAEMARRFHIARVVERCDDVLDDPAVDAVYIPLPNHLHHPWTLKALAAGKHVLCEKPLATTARQAEEMAAAAQCHGRVLMEALMYRFHPRSLRIRQMVARGEIGRPRLVRVAFTFAMDPETLTAGTHFRLVPEKGGGSLLDVGSYGVGTATWMMGALPRSVHGMANRTPGGVDTLFVGSMAFDGGAMATIEAGFAAALQQTFSITGTRGSIELPHDAFIPWERPAAFTVRGRDDETGILHRVDGTDEYRLMVEHFGDVVAGRQPVAIPPAESVGNLRVLDALAASAGSGRRVSLPAQTDHSTVGE